MSEDEQDWQTASSGAEQPGSTGEPWRSQQYGSAQGSRRPDQPRYYDQGGPGSQLGYSQSPGYGQQYGPQDHRVHYGYGRPQAYGHPGNAEPAQGMGIAGFVTGVTGLVLCWFPFAGLAIAGLVCGIIGAVIGLLIAIVFFVGLSAAGNSTY